MKIEKDGDSKEIAESNPEEIIIKNPLSFVCAMNLGELSFEVKKI
jgi:hypothetical protein